MTSESRVNRDVWTRLSQTIGRLLGFLLRFLFVILLAIGLAAGVYYGVPWLYGRLVQPVQTHSSQITLLNNEVQNLRGSLADSQAAQDERLTALETSGDAQRQRLAAAETSAATAQDALAAESAARAELAADVSALQTEISQLASDVKALSASLSNVEPTAATAAQEVAMLQQQVTLLEARNGLLLARLQWTAENFGETRMLLKENLVALREMVASFGPVSDDARASMATRLVTAEALIEKEPGAALIEMESVWAQLSRALNPAASSEAASSTAAEATATPSSP